MSNKIYSYYECGNPYGNYYLDEKEKAIETERIRLEIERMRLADEEEKLEKAQKQLEKDKCEVQKERDRIEALKKEIHDKKYKESDLAQILDNP